MISPWQAPHPKRSYLTWARVDSIDQAAWYQHRSPTWRPANSQSTPKTFQDPRHRLRRNVPMTLWKRRPGCASGATRWRRTSASGTSSRRLSSGGVHRIEHSPRRTHCAVLAPAAHSAYAPPHCPPAHAGVPGAFEITRQCSLITSSFCSASEALHLSAEF